MGEIYNLGAMSHVKVSFDSPEYTANVDAIGTLRILEAVRILGLTEKTKIYQASTSELYGLVQEVPQSEESPLRGETFVTRKITRGASRIALGLQDKIFLGNLDAKRDWGHAKDYVEGMWKILQHDTPEDFVIATGVTTTIRDFVKMSFSELGIELEFKGEGVDEVGTVVKCNNPEYQLEIGKEIIAVDPRYFRPTEVELLIGDPAKMKEKLGWVPKYDLAALVKD